MVEIAFPILFQHKIALLSSKKDLDELRLWYKMSVMYGTPRTSMQSTRQRKTFQT